MAWNSLKSSVRANIKTNSNQEITGAVLQNVLSSIIDTLGENYTFVGVAKPDTTPGTPDGPVFYIAFETGIYSGFSGIEIKEDEPSAKILAFKNGNWQVINSGIIREVAFNSLNEKLEPILIDTPTVEYIEDNNFIWAIHDAEQKFLIGIKADGSVEWSKGIPTPIFLQFLEQKKQIDANMNGISTKVDKEPNKSLAPDFISSLLSENETVEEYMEMTLDNENHVLGYRDKEGCRHEEKMSINHLKLSENAATELAKTLASVGIDNTNVLDLSNKTDIQIAEPRCAIVNISNISQMPTTKTDDLHAWLEFWDGQGNYFKKRVILNAQGSSSLYHPKKNYAVDFCEDEWIGDDTTSVKIGDWVVQDSFHVKAFYFDAFRGICPTMYKIWDEIYKSRGVLNDRPYKYLYVDKYENYGYGYAEEPTDIRENFNSCARTFPDGFPVLTFLNNRFYGVFSWQLKKHRDNMAQNKKNTNHIHLDLAQNSPWSGINLEWTDFEIRNPKDLYCQDGTKYDGENPKELMGSDSLYYDSSNSKHVMSAEVKNNILSTRTKFQELRAMPGNASDDDIRAKIAEIWDVDNVIDYIIMTQATGNTDSYCRNIQWATWDGVRWTSCPYDWDTEWGIGLTPIARSVKHFRYWTCDPNVDDASRPKVGKYQPFAWIFNYYSDELKARYKYLRESGILTTDNIIKHLNNWVSRIGVQNYEKEFKQWPQTPGWRDGHLDSSNWRLTHDQQVTPDANGIVKYDNSDTGETVSISKYDSQKQYNIGDECYYGFENEWVKEFWRFKCVSKCSGKAPITSFYGASPCTLGYHESIYRVKKWSDEMLNWMDSQLLK